MRRRSLLLGVGALSVAALWLAATLQALPPGVLDIARRGWPVLLVLAGLVVLLRRRVPLAGALALVASAGLVAGVVTLAYRTRAEQPRTDYTETVAQPIDGGVVLLRVQVQSLDTDVALVRAPAGAPREVRAQFVGSSESMVRATYFEEADSTALFTLTEQRGTQFPLLSAVGRGRLEVTLPDGLPIDVQLDALDGQAALSLGGLALERLNVSLARGNALVTLPAYAPQFTPGAGLLGTLAVPNGTLTVRVPPDVAGRFELSGVSGTPDYPPTAYNYLVGNVLEARNIDAAATRVRYALAAPRVELQLADATTP